MSTPQDPTGPAVRTRHEATLLRQLRAGQDRATDAVTAFAGSLSFVYIHVGWFGLWVVVNVGLIGAGSEFDRFPFGLLTLIVSLEAIFLSTFVMISQNRSALRADVRAELDFETNLRSEVWSAYIGQTLGLDPVAVEQVVQGIVEQSRAELTKTSAEDAFAAAVLPPLSAVSLPAGSPGARA